MAWRLATSSLLALLSLILSLAMNWSLFFLMSFSWSLDRRVGGRGLQVSWQNLSTVAFLRILPWKFQIQYALSTLWAHQDTPVMMYLPVGSHSTSVHMKCSPTPMLVKSLVSMNSRTPFMLLSPAKTTNCPVGAQNRWLAVFLSYFFRISGSEPCQDHKLSSWSPEQMVGSLPLVLLQNLRFCALLQTIEGDIERLRISMDDTKLVSHRLPAEGMNSLLNLDGVHGNLLLVHVEDLKVLIHSRVLDVLVLQHLPVPVHLDTEIVSRLLPVHLAVRHIEQVLDPQLLPGGNLEDDDPRGNILGLTHPVGNDVVLGRPGESLETLDLDTFLVKKSKTWSFINRQNSIF